MKSKILIIDDDKDVCAVLEKNLLSFGYNVSSVFSGNQALESIKNQCYDLALLDLKLPDSSGSELLKQIRGIDSRIIVIILTAYPSIESAIETLKEYQASDYIRKPFNIEHLRITIQKALENKALKKGSDLARMHDIGRTIREIRKNKSLSLDALARKTELSKSFLSEFERGKKCPRLETLKKITEVLEVDIHFLLKK